MAKKPDVQSRLRGKSHPLLYEVDARSYLRELSLTGGNTMTLATLPDRVLDEWAALGIDAVWLMGVWTTGSIGLEIARKHALLQEECRRALPDFTLDDIVSSPYAVQAYTVSPQLGGNEALRMLRKRLAARGLGLILDFVCNHTACDHEWVWKNPEYYVAGTKGEETTHADLFFSAKTSKGEMVLAYGRDPAYPGWTDTAQLNYALPAVWKAVMGELEKIAGMCDGVRCDMAMLILKDVFARTWGERAMPVNGEPPTGEFWKDAIASMRHSNPGFLFIAEVYWNLEWELQQLGFDYTYDKILYDRLLREGAGAVRDHLKAEMDFQRHSVRFIENHDEQRAALALASEPWHFAAATIMATVPGMVLIHEGQIEGRLVRLPVQLSRRPSEAVSQRTKLFYRQLLSCVCHPVFQRGDWMLLSARPAWHDNLTWQDFLLFWWQEKAEEARLVVVNYAPHSGQCYVDVPVERLNGLSLEFRDLLGDAAYVRERAGLVSRGMYFDLRGYGLHIFEVKAVRF